MCKRLSDGLDKLKLTREEIEQLRLDVAKQAVVVNEKTEACRILLHEIETATVSAAEKKEIVESKSQEMRIRTKEIEKEKAEAEEVRFSFSFSFVFLFLADPDSVSRPSRSWPRRCPQWRQLEPPCRSSRKTM